METSRLWDSSKESDWQTPLDRYWTFIKPCHIAIEKEFDSFDANTLQEMDKNEWYEFLKNKYFYWKFTTPNRYKTTINHLKKYLDPEESLDKLYSIKQKLLQFDKGDIETGLKTAQEIRGLGTAGASGLLAVLFPNYFSTVDQFVVKALFDVTHLPERNIIKDMNPEQLNIKDGVILTSIMRNKATDLNQRFSTNQWTPRKVDMVLWVSSR